MNFIQLLASKKNLQFSELFYALVTVKLKLKYRKNVTLNVFRICGHFCMARPWKL